MIFDGLVLLFFSFIELIVFIIDGLTTIKNNKRQAGLNSIIFGIIIFCVGIMLSVFCFTKI